MSGHSKWSTIKRRKGAQDAVRSKIFARISREIIVAVKEGGGDAEANARLRSAITKAKSENMPNANIERAIQRGRGGSDSENYEEIVYEGYAKGGVAVLVQCLTDNRNRTSAQVRHLFHRCGGNVGETGCVAYMFQRRGILLYDSQHYNNEALLNDAIDCDVEDVQESGEMIELSTTPEQFSNVLHHLEQKGYEALRAEILLVPLRTVVCDEELTRKTINFVQQLEEMDDVQNVFHNLEDDAYDFSDGVQ